jgi:hypothetical protein
MRASDVIVQLRAKLPQYTALFTNDLSVSSMTASSTTITTVTTTPHGLTVGDLANIVGAQNPNPIISLSRNLSIVSIVRFGDYATLTTIIPHKLIPGDIFTVSGANEMEFNINNARIVKTGISTIVYYIGPGSSTSATGTLLLTAQSIAYATTSNPTDLTEDPVNGVTVDIINATQTQYNGTKILRGVISNTIFCFQVIGQPIPETGSPLLLETLSYSYNGMQIVTNIINATTFQFVLQKAPSTNAYGTIICRVNARISGVADPNRIIESYTKMGTNLLVAFVKLDDIIVSKARDTQTDATAMVSPGDIYNIFMITPFSVFVVAPTSNEIAARVTRDLMHNEVTVALYKSILGARLPSTFTEQQAYQIIPTGHSLYDYNVAYYIHKFDFETTERVNIGDIIDQDSIALNQVIMQYELEQSSSIDFAKVDTINTRGDE